jgi:hypothetical protein
MRLASFATTRRGSERGKRGDEARRRYRFSAQGHPREAPRCTLHQGRARCARGHIYKQARRGRPGPDTSYRKISKRCFDIKWTTDQDAIAYDHNGDGMYPLITNDRKLSPAQILEAYNGQPMIEKRFEKIKTVQEIAPVLLKNEGASKPYSLSTSSLSSFRP